MTAPSLTLRSLQNEETGIDISVPGFQEEEAPLGGVSILYDVSVLTKLDMFKTRLHTNEDVVQFSVLKAYREIEDLYNKLSKKYPESGLPTIPKSSVIGKYSNQEKVAALDSFMQAVSKNSDLCKSSLFSHFIGIHSQRLSVTTPSSTSSENGVIQSDLETEKSKESEDLTNVFAKVKSATAKTENKVVETVPTNVEKVDLFEEVKLVKRKETSHKKGATIGGLFDDFEDENLFSTKPISKPDSPPKQAPPNRKVQEAEPKKKEPEKKPESITVDDSQIIIKDRKLGNISLFDEQDLGDYVTQEEEALFLITPDNEKSKKNTLLFSSSSEPIETDTELHENLDDLLNLNPLPASPASKDLKPSRLTEDESKSKEKLVQSSNEVEHQPKKPVPLPRKKSLGKSDTDELATTKPEVMPRKVFLAKPEVPSKPVSSAATSQNAPKSTKPPPISAKPVLPPKPKPPPKAPKPTLRKDSKDLDALNANKPAKVPENQNTMSSLTDDLNKLDILKYIEQEQKTLDAEPSLFD